MKSCVLCSSIGWLIVFLPATATAQQYDVAFSTFFGGSAGEGIRDVEVDGAGNVYVAGTTRSPDFPTTPGAYDEQFDTSLGTTRWGYNSEIFVAKFSLTGDLVWSTIVGGPNSEEAYGLEIDSKGCVVVHGRGAPGSPITPGVYQEQFKGCGGGDPGNPHNTAQNAYICKLSPDGSSLLWASFFGIDHVHRDLALDKNDDIYVTWGVRPDENDPSHWDTWMKPAWNARAFQPEPQGGADCGAAKIASDGSRVLWATYLGGSDYDSIAASIRVDGDGYVYVGLQTRSKDIPTTPGAHDRTHNGGVDWYVAKLLPDGSDIVYGTFIGDEGDNWINTHNLAVDSQGNCYSSTCAFSASFPTTANAVQRTFGGGKVDWGIVKLSPTGALLAGTLLGGGGLDNPDGIRVDAEGNLVLFGQTGSADFPVSPNAYQPTKGARNDAVIVKLSPNLDRILYSTFLGGDGNDAGRAGCVGNDGSMIVAGVSSGQDWPTKNAAQNARRGPGDAIVAKLSPIRDGSKMDSQSSETQLTRPGPAAADLDSGLLGYWKFEEGRGLAVEDAAGRGNHGRLKNMDSRRAWVAGCPQAESRHALRFDGRDDCVEVTDRGDLAPPESLTVACWVRLSRIKQERENHTFVGKWGPGPDGVGESFIFWMGESAPKEQLCFWASAGPWSSRAGTQISYTTNAHITPGRWCYVAVVWRADETPVFYQDGVALDSTEKGSPYKRTIPRIQETRTPIKLGQGDRNPPRGIHRLEGELDEVRLYNRALSPAEIAALAGVSEPEGGAQREAVP